MYMQKNKIKTIIWKLKGGYKPKRFWDKWATTFMNDPWQVETHEQHKWILEKVKMDKPTSILEVGCGFGRNIKYLIDNNYPAEKITGIDISSQMIKQAKKFINNKKVSLVVGECNNLPFKDNSFDMVLIHGVFMHIKPEVIDESIKEVIRVSKKYIIQVEQNFDGNEFTFIHAYEKLYKKNRVKIIELKKRNDLMLDFIYGKVQKKFTKV